MPSGNKPLIESMFIQFYVAKWRHHVTMIWSCHHSSVSLRPILVYVATMFGCNDVWLAGHRCFKDDAFFKSRLLLLTMQTDGAINMWSHKKTLFITAPFHYINLPFRYSTVGGMESVSVKTVPFNFVHHLTYRCLTEMSLRLLPINSWIFLRIETC